MAHDLSKLPEVTVTHIHVLNNLLNDPESLLTEDERSAVLDARKIISYVYGAQIGHKAMEKRSAK